MDSTNAEAVYVHGLCLYFIGDLENSLIAFHRSAVLDPDNANANVHDMLNKAKRLKEMKDEGKKLYAAGNFQAAYTVYTRALHIDPRNKGINSTLYYNRALANKHIGNIPDAIKDCSSALEFNKNYLKPFLLRAGCHSDLKNFKEAIQDYESALSIENSYETKSKLEQAKFALDRSKRNPYNILEICNTASVQEIKFAYYKQARMHHPDKHPDASLVERNKQEEHFKKVLEAYTILSDTQQRERYDSEQYGVN